MAIRKFRSRTPRRQKRAFSIISSFNSNLVSVAPNSLSVIPLLTPTVPASQTLATQIYSTMGRVVLAKTNFNFDCTLAGTLSGTTTYAAMGIGIYVDSDAVDATNPLRPLQDGNSTDWLLWHYFVLRSGAFSIVSTPAPGGVVLSNHTSQLYKRYAYTMTRYKRKMDTSNDSLVMVVQNSAQSTQTAAFTFYNKFLFVR